jgi:S1-C subfamily serine protease
VAAGLIIMLAAGIAIGRAASGNSPAASRTPAIGARTAPTVAVPPSAQDLQQTVENVIHSVQPSVVEVTSSGEGQQGIGSGDILTTDGYIVTNDHVVQGFSAFAVTLSSGKTVPAQVVGEDAQDDLAVLKVSITNARPIALADSSSVQVGEFAIAVGNPLGLQQSATLGIVSALNRSASEAPQGPASELTGLIQTSAPINPGNSGGALVDLHGQLIGIPTLGVTDQQTGGTADGIGFAIASNRVKYVANQLIQNGKLTSTGQGFLGVESEDVTPQLAAVNNLSVQSGALVAGFAQDAAGSSPAQAAGLQIGDVIVGVDGQHIGGSEDLGSALLTKAPGTHVSLTVVRGSRQLTISVTLGERPTNAQG